MKNYLIKLLLAAGLPVVLAGQLTAQNSDTAGSGYRFRVGGYGEMVASFKNYGINRFYGGSGGNTHTTRNTISIPRFVLAIDYRFNDRWTLGAEIEIESGGVGTACELENTENGEYETEVEKGGEVALEQFHITRSFLREINLRFGHIIVPIGITNAHHEPVNFFGTVRPEGESTLIPCTWHENGAEVFGNLGRSFYRFDYNFMVVSGLNLNGFDRNTWAGSARQGIFEEDNFTCPAIAARIQYHGVPGLRIGGSYYYCADASRNADKSQNYATVSGRCGVRIVSADVQYIGRGIILRSNILAGHLDNSLAVSAVNTKLSNKSPYSRLTPIASRAVSCAGELGYNIASKLTGKKFPELIPFVRYEYYNPQQEGEPGQTMDPRLKTSMWVCGINYKILPNLVAKFDYTNRQIGSGKIFGGGTYNSENEFAVGLAYVGWFFQK